jgi:hypothetical protein
MAGLGRKTFTAGDVLTASDVQSYLQDQTVMVFAGTAARSSAISSPTEGMITLQTDTDQLTYYTGSTWNVVLPLNNPTIVDSTTYPNQLVNRNSSVSRPIPYATNVGTGTIAAPSALNTIQTVTITFTSGRFTQPPIVSVTAQNSLTNPRVVGAQPVTLTTGFTATQWQLSGGTLQATDIYWVAVQMTSAASAG